MRILLLAFGNAQGPIGLPGLGRGELSDDNERKQASGEGSYEHRSRWQLSANAVKMIAMRPCTRVAPRLTGALRRHARRTVFGADADCFVIARRIASDEAQPAQPPDFARGQGAERASQRSDLRSTTRDCRSFRELVKGRLRLGRNHEQMPDGIYPSDAISPSEVRETHESRPAPACAADQCDAANHTACRAAFGAASLHARRDVSADSAEEFAEFFLRRSRAVRRCFRWLPASTIP